MDLILIKDEIVLVRQPQGRVLVTGAPQGVPGPPGAAGTGEDLELTAGETLGGNRVVMVADDGKAYYADPTDVANAYRIVGITTAAASAETTVTVRARGPMTEPGWSWTLGNGIYLGAAGTLTQTPPVTGLIIEMGVPLSATRMLIDTSSPIQLI